MACIGFTCCNPKNDDQENNDKNVNQKGNKKFIIPQKPQPAVLGIGRIYGDRPMCRYVNNCYRKNKRCFISYYD